MRTVGTNPASTAVGDFNRDGELDLVTANKGSTDVSVMLGSGAGGFGPATSFTAGSSPMSVAVGDFNDDGNPDLAVANSGSNNVSVLLGNGAGGFGAAANFAVGSSPDSVAAGDFNNDGKLDLAVVNGGSNNVSVLLGNGAGAFGAATNFATGSTPSSVVVADFNGDGSPDLAVTDLGASVGTTVIAPSEVSVLLGDGAGGFGTATNFAAGRNEISVTGGDFNGDGKPDLVIANNNSSDSVSVLLGDGAGGFSTPISFIVGGAPTSLAVADFNGDGKSDLAAANEDTANVSVLLGDGAGGFGTATNFAVGSHPFSVDAGDFNGDGKPDLAAGNFSSNDVSLLLNTSTPAVSLSASVLTFASQAVGSYSSAQTVTVTNTGAAPLLVSSATAIGGDADEFLKSGDSCTGVAVLPGSSCTIGVRFAPLATGTTTDQLRIISNAPTSPDLVLLSGEASPAPAPAAGPQGPAGANGSNGANGPPGPQGNPGTNGSSGTGGAMGSQGPAGSRAPRYALVTCMVLKRKRTEVKVTCTIKLSSRAARAAGVRIARATRVYAAGYARARQGQAKIALRLRHPLHPGRYTVLLNVYYRNGRTGRLAEHIHLD